MLIIIKYPYWNKPPMNQYLNLNCRPTPQNKQKENAPGMCLINVEQLLSPILKLKLLAKCQQCISKINVNQPPSHVSWTLHVKHRMWT